jgi:hypothetical protein
MIEERGYPNWFSSQINNFEKHLSVYKNKDVKFLQIGVYLGHASKYMLDNILLAHNSKLLDVDTWTGSTGSDENLHNAMDWNYIEKKYDQDLSKYLHTKKLIKNKSTSDEFFKNNKETFDFIYIDGNHETEYVKKDAINSLNFLNNNGIIAFDDYGGLIGIRDVADNILKNNNFELIEKNWQFWIRKK